MTPFLKVTEVEHGAQKDTQIEAERSLPQVTKFSIHPAGHSIELGSLTPQALDMGQTCHNGLEWMTLHVDRDKLAIVLVVIHGMGAGANQAHGTGEQIQEMSSSSSDQRRRMEPKGVARGSSRRASCRPVVQPFSVTLMVRNMSMRKERPSRP